MTLVCNDCPLLIHLYWISDRLKSVFYILHFIQGTLLTVQRFMQRPDVPIK